MAEVERDVVLGADEVARFAASIGYPAGLVPPTYGMALVARGDVGLDAALTALAQKHRSIVVHATQSIQLQRTLKVGETVRLRMTLSDPGEPGPNAKRVTLTVTLSDRDGSPAVTMKSGMFLLPSMPPANAKKLPDGSGPPCASRVFTAADVALYASASGDRNPIHLDPAVASAFGLRAPIAHGMLVLGWMTGVFATEHPQEVLRSLDCIFVSPVFVGDEGQARIGEQQGDKYRFSIANSDDNLVLSGSLMAQRIS
ncbi:MAG: MaoC/PaaZ C-terminal domain-containing protein [Hyphomicrobiales bacterium]